MHKGEKNVPARLVPTPEIHAILYVFCYLTPRQAIPLSMGLQYANYFDLFPEKYTLTTIQLTNQLALVNSPMMCLIYICR